MLTELDAIQDEALSLLASCTQTEDLEQWRIDWLGSKGRLKSLMGRMKDVEAADRPAFGQRMNTLKQALNQAFDGSTLTLRV